MSFVVYSRFYFWLIKIHGNWPPATSTPKGNTKCEILLEKVFSLKQKTNQILLATVENIKFCLFCLCVPTSFL